MDEKELAIGKRVRLKEFAGGIVGTIIKIDALLPIAAVWLGGEIDEKFGASWWNAEKLVEVPEFNPETLEEIRDLARTSLAPIVLNMTEEEWAKHRLNKIAGIAAHELDRIKGENDGRN